MSTPTQKRATIEDFLAIPESERFHELIDGLLVRKADPSGEHGDGQSGVIAWLKHPFQRPPGRGGPGGWWIFSEVEVRLSTGEIVRPDVVGWRRETMPSPVGFPIDARPDWVCEVLSPSNPAHDRVTKLHVYHREHVGHYWIVDPRDQTVTVLRWSEPGYVMVLAAKRDQRVRAEPFDAIEIEVGTLFGDDPSA